MTAVSLIVPLVLGFLPLEGADSGPSSEEVHRARQKFQGAWSFTAINDNGEKFGPDVIHRAFARDGLIVVNDRALKIINPETGASRTATYRLDPSKSPHWIDLINQDDRMFQGIYEFDGDALVICLERDPDGPRPTDFGVPQNSERVVFHLSHNTNKNKGTVKKANMVVGADEAPPLEPAGTVASSPAPVPVSAPAPPPRARKPSEGELRIGYEMLTGNWEIESIIDDGSDLGPRLIRSKFAEDGRLRIADRTATFITPKSLERHVSTIRIDPSRSPNWIDVTTQLDSVLKGIYRFEGDRLFLCLAKYDGADRPTEFEAPTGSDRILFRLRFPKNAPKVKPTSEVVSSEVVSSPAPAAAPMPLPEPSPDEKARAKDDMIRDMLAGSWMYSDRKGTVTLMLRADGTFVSTRAWAKAIKRLFEGNTTTSEGRWSYTHGALNGRISATTDPFLLGHVYSARLQTIGEDTLVFKDAVGQLRMARKLR